MALRPASGIFRASAGSVPAVFTSCLTPDSQFSRLGREQSINAPRVRGWMTGALEVCLRSTKYFAQWKRRIGTCAIGTLIAASDGPAITGAALFAGVTGA